MLANTLISLLIVHWDSSFSDLVRVSMIKSKFGDANSVKGMMCKRVFRNLNSTFQTFPEIWLLSLPQTNYNLFLLAFQKIFLKKKSQRKITTSLSNMDILAQHRGLVLSSASFLLHV